MSDKYSNFAVDAVVTYVDNRDPVWQAAFAPYAQHADAVQRFRFWNTLMWWLRAAACNMPWIRTVHVVVSNIEQIPSCIDKTKIHVVLHEDIIPHQLLPTFNSTTIEMYICKIPGLAEHFIYSNDDMIPMMPLTVDDFFIDGKPHYDLNICKKSCSTFLSQCKNSYMLAAKLAGYSIVRTDQFSFIKHYMTPMLKSICEEIHQKAGAKILDSCTKFREPFNYTQYLFPDYILMSGKGVEQRWPYFEYVRMEAFENNTQLLDDTSCKIICINDSTNVKNPDDCYKMLQLAFEKKFPSKSKFEL